MQIKLTVVVVVSTKAHTHTLKKKEQKEQLKKTYCKGGYRVPVFLPLKSEAFALIHS